MKRLFIFLLLSLISIELMSQQGNWYIPSSLGTSPALLIIGSDNPPDGYEFAGNPCCVQDIVDGDSYCLNNVWDSICQDAYNVCAQEYVDSQEFCLMVVCNNSGETYECNTDFDYDQDLPQNAYVLATCGYGSLGYTDEIEDLDCGFVLNRTWTGTDIWCANSAQCEENFVFLDTTGPDLLSFPSNQSFLCTETIIYDEPVVEDCSAITWEVISNEVYEDCTTEIERLYSATDACGNTLGIPLSHFITIDHTPCREWYIPYEIGFSAAFLACPEEVDTDLFYAPENQQCMEDLIAADPFCIETDWDSLCQDNLNECILQNSPLTIVANDMTFECGEDMPEQLAFLEGGCINQTLVFTETIEQSCGGLYSITRDYVATDDCGSEVTATQLITIEDTTAPILEIPYDIIVECGDDNLQNLIGMAQATDECSELVIGYVDIMTSDDCVTTIERIWEATDECGNSTQGTQVITIVDITAPVFTYFPDDLTFSCTELIDYETPTVEDCSGENYYLEQQVTIERLECSEIITLTYTAEDFCGNSTTGIQVITVLYEDCQQWFIPNDFGTGSDSEPAIYSCFQPEGYALVVQDCFPYIISENPGCVTTDWSSECNTYFNECANNGNQTCGDPIACNYNPLVPQYLNQYCDYSCNGCTYAGACNYEPNAVNDDGSCIYPGCTDSNFLNYSPLAGCDDGSCSNGTNVCPGDFNNDGLISSSDLTQFLSVFGLSCD